MNSEHVALTLLSLKGIGPRFVQSTLARNVSLESLSELLSYLSTQQQAPFKKEELEHAWIQSGESLCRAADSNIKVLAWDNPSFPDQLRNIPNPPAVLFVLGDMAALSPLSAAVIGTREPSSYGEKSGRKIAQTLAEAGIVVVSGLAEGCDTAAHQGCLDAGGKTVAVLAHGFGKIYPKANAGLATEILNSGGCLLSEYQPGTPARRSSFVERDRLQSGLSSTVIIVETDIQGGTMHTVSFAEKQGRLLAAIKHPPGRDEHPKSRGNAHLIKAGKALPLADATDLRNLIQRIRTRSKNLSMQVDELRLS